MNYILSVLRCLTICFTLITNHCFSTHYMGGEITYECLGGNQYKVTLNIYRDCSGANVGASQSVTVESASCGQNFNATLSLVNSQEVSPLCPADIGQSSCNGGALPGVEQYVYEGNVTLPANCTDWVISRNFNNRNGAVTNLVAASGESMYIETRIDNSNPALCNSSPVFTSLPVPFICQDQPFAYNHGAVDNEGDSLVYSLINPLGAGATLIPYTGTLSPSYPLVTTTGTFPFSTTDGSMNFTPTGMQVAVVTVRVEEYRGGVLLGSIMRDVQIVTLSCTNDPPFLVNGGIDNMTGGGNLVTPFDIQVCPGETVDFDIDLGDPNGLDLLTVTSNILTVMPGATVTYTGTNPVEMNVNWNAGAAGLRSFTVDVRDDACPSPGIQVYTFNIDVLTGTSAGPDRNFCVGSNPVQLSANGGTSWTWSPPAGLSCTNCQNPTASPGSTTIYTVTSDLSGTCGNTDQVTVNVSAGTPANTSPISGDTINICPGGPLETYSVVNTIGSTYQWFVPTGGVLISGQGTNSINVQWNSITVDQMFVIETNTAGCLGDTVDVAVNIAGPPTNPITGPDFICKNSLGDNANTSYTTSGPPNIPWPYNNPPDPISNPTDAGTSFYEWSVTFGGAVLDAGAASRGEKAQSNVTFPGYAGPVILQVIEVDDQGCRHAPATKEIDVVARPNAPVLSGPTQVCPNQEYTFTAVTGDDFLWDFGIPASGVTILSGDSTSAVTVRWGNNSQFIQALAGTPACPSFAPGGLNVQVFPINLTNITSTYASCGTTFRVQNNETWMYQSGSQIWVVPPGFSIVGGGNGQSFIDLQQDSPNCYMGDVCFTAANTQGCRDTICVSIPGNPLPACVDPGTAFLGPAGPIVQCGGTATITCFESGVAPPGGFEYEFFYDDGLGGGYVSVQGPGGTNSYNAGGTGDYYCVVTDPFDPATCVSISDTVAVQIDVNPTSANAGTNQNICATTTTMAGNTPTVGNGLWSVVAGTGLFTSSNDPGTDVSSLSTGLNTLRWTISNGSCPPSTSDVDITVVAPPSSADAGTDQSICDTFSTFAAIAAGSGTGTWSLVAGTGSITTVNDESSAVTGLGIGTNTFAWTISTNAPCTDSVDQVDIVVNPSPSAALAGTDQNICGDSTRLDGNTPVSGTGTWTIVSGSAVFSNINDPQTDVTNLGAGTNTFRWTISTGTCTDQFDEVDIITDLPPSAAVAGLDQNTCTDTAFLAGNIPGSGTGTWSVVAGGPASFSNANDPSAMVTGFPVGQTTLRWTISTPGVCPDSTDDLIIDYTGSAVASVIINPGSPAPVCAGANFTFHAIPTNPGSSPMFEWFLNGVSQGIGTSDSIEVIAPSDGDSLRVILISSLSCATGSPASSTLVTISIDDPPTASNAGSNDTICTTSYSLGANSPTTGTGTWSVVSGSGSFTPNVNDPNAAVSSLGVGDNILRWTINNGTCPDQIDSIIITRAGTLTTANAGSDISGICEDNPISMTNANSTAPGETGTWTVATGSATFGNVNDSITNLTGLGTGVNSLVWSIDNGVCPISRDTVLVMVDTLASTANAGIDQNTCATAVFLNSNNPLVGTGLWSIVNGPGTTIVSPNDTNTQITGIGGPGTYTYSWTISSGSCPISVDSLDIIKSGTITTADAGVDDTLCETTTVLLLSSNAVNPGNGETGGWSVVTGPVGSSFNDSTLTSATISNLMPGIYTLRWRIQNGVCPPSDDFKLVNVDLLPEAALPGVDSFVCGDNYTMTGTNPVTGNGTWTTTSGATIANPNSALSSVSNLDIGPNVFFWTVSNGGVCPDNQANVTITSDSISTPDVALGVNTNPSCLGTPLNFTTFPQNGGTPTYRWYIDGVLQVDTLSTFNPLLLLNGQTVRVEMISSLQCSSVPSVEDSIQIVVMNPPFPIVTGGDQHICTGQSATWNVTGSGGAFQWIDSTTGSVVGTGSSLNTSTAGTYYVTEDNGVCPVGSSGTVTLQVSQQPNVDAGPNLEVFVNNSILINGTVDIGSISWSPSLNLNNSNTATPVFTPDATQAGYNTLILSSTNGICTDTSSVIVLVRTPVVVPNSFTPNSDGNNDLWEITGLEGFPDVVLTVYNRWGSLVYKSIGKIDWWDGFRNNEPMPIATYYYILDLGDESIPLSGSVTIVR